MSYPPWPDWTVEQWRAARVQSIAKYDPSQPRDEQGRFALLHGTSAASLEIILREGIKAEHSGEMWPDASKPGLVYLTTDYRNALVWASHASQVARDYGRVAILTVRIPEDRLADLVLDEHYAGMPGNQQPQRQFKGDIPPEWIIGAKIGTKRYVSPEFDWEEKILKKVAGDGQIVYVVIVLKESVTKYAPNQPRQPKGSAQGGEFASKAPVLQGVDSKANAKALIAKHLAFHKDIRGEEPDAATLKAAEDELRALPLVHGTTIYGALGAATDGLMSHQEMQKQAMKLVDEADGLREEINERWPSPEDDDSWPDNIEDIRSQMGLGQSEAEEMLGMIQELESVEKVLHGTTFPEDTKAGLDRFVFMTHGEKHQDYGNIAVIIDNEVIQDGWATERDIIQTPGVSVHRPKEGLKNAEYAGIEKYQATIIKGDDYYAVAAAKAGSPTAVANRSRDQLFEMKAPRVPKSAVKGFVVEDDYEAAQRLAYKLAEKGSKLKVLFVLEASATSERRKFVQDQMKTLQATGGWDEDAIEKFHEEHEGVYLL